jgi:hypothetical protein
MQSSRDCLRGPLHSVSKPWKSRRHLQRFRSFRGSQQVPFFWPLVCISFPQRQNGNLEND